MTPFEKAEMAKQLLANPVLKEAFNNIREGLVSRAEQSGFGDFEEHHNIALSLQILKRINTELNRFVGDQTVIAHKQKSDSFIARMRERIA